jgi:hypothetical protein
MLAIILAILTGMAVNLPERTFTVGETGEQPVRITTTTALSVSQGGLVFRKDGPAEPIGVVSELGGAGFMLYGADEVGDFYVAMFFAHGGGHPIEVGTTTVAKIQWQSEFSGVTTVTPIPHSVSDDPLLSYLLAPSSTVHEYESMTGGEVKFAHLDGE